MTPYAPVVRDGHLSADLVSCDGPLGPGLPEVLVGDDVVGDVVDHHHVLPVRLDGEGLGQRQGHPLGPGAGLSSSRTHAQKSSKVTTGEPAEGIQVRRACDTNTWLPCMPQHNSREPDPIKGLTESVKRPVVPSSSRECQS